MKKLFTSFLVAGTVASFAKCGKKEAKPAAKKETTTENKTETKTIVKGTLQKGTFKVGYAGSDSEYTKALKDTLTAYTQDTTNKVQTGDEFFKLPSGLFLVSSNKFNSFVGDQTSYETEWKKLKTWLDDNVVNVDGKDVKNGGSDYQKASDPRNSSAKDNKEAILGLTKSDGPSVAEYTKIFSDENIKKLYNILETTRPTAKELKKAMSAIKEFPVRYANVDFENIADYTGGGNPKITSADGERWTKNPIGRTLTIVFNDNGSLFDSATVQLSKTFKQLGIDSKDTIIESLEDKTKLASKNIDTLFVHVTDGVENKADVYKAVVEKKEFKETKLFFIGEKAKSQDGASSKVFAGGNVSTASFNEYASAYIAGFQAAAGAIKFSSSEDVMEETTVSFLIGATSESKDKKKAFAFRRGVEAAAAHSAYSKYLKVKFVSKTEDSSKSSKKLYREVSEWKAIDDSKTKLYEFTSSDTFSDADRRIIYIAGTSARDWRGENTLTSKLTKADVSIDDIKVEKDDDFGLVGALYNYKKPTAAGAYKYKDLTTKSYSRGVWLILDKAIKGSIFLPAKYGANTWDYPMEMETSDDALTSKARSGYAEGYSALERHQVKFYGAIGQEVEGTKTYAEAALKGLYMAGPSYMLGKHTIFGAKLDLSALTTDKFSGSDQSSSEEKLTPWTFKNNSGTKDSKGKIEDRFEDSFKHATEKELTEAELVKASPWLK